MSKIIAATFFLLINCSLLGQNKLQQDRETIRSMAGCYRVTFEFAETFAPDTAYKYHERKIEDGIEFVILVEDTEHKISLQHLLLVGDSMIIKHWRQDWIYENRDLSVYWKDNTWKSTRLSAEQAKGTWTQKVFQVDDSPRYEGYGTWNHVDGRHFWESTADAPLPRREFTKRSDYNVLRRHSRMELKPQGWILEQDNEKIIRDDAGNDKLLCWEKGFETFTKGNYNCSYANWWWTQNTAYWADVRQVWEEIFREKSIIKLEKKIDGHFLYEKLFDLEETYTGKTDFNHSEAKTAIKKIIESYIAKS
ncbi:MAG: hypothetical protein K0R65_1055 [Crocinitomicaceae bacterium]|jgi:hypothetical protein|nr:hypothetical protein [Crocinitomicaceae bacterium]